MTKRELTTLYKEYNLQYFIILEDDLGFYVNVDVDVYLSGLWDEIEPLRFGKVRGSFSCFNGAITSLNGCPREVSGNFDCRINYLTSFNHAPLCVGGLFFYVVVIW